MCTAALEMSSSKFWYNLWLWWWSDNLVVFYSLWIWIVYKKRLYQQKKTILRVTESIAVSTEPKWILRHNIPDNIKLSSNIRTFYSFDRSSKSISVSLFGTNLPESLSLTVTHLHDPRCDGANLVQKAAARLSPSGDFGIKANLFLISRRATLKGFNFIAKSVI